MYRPSLYRRCVTWMRVVLPPAWTVAMFVVLYVAAEILRVLLEPAVAFGQPDRVWTVAAPRNGTVLMGVVLYAMFRVFGFHPLSRYEYGRWLYNTPWRHPQPLPLGPVHLTPQDGLLVALAVLLCHGTPHAQLAVPQAFLVTYFAASSFLAYQCDLRWRVYGLVFGIGLVAWLGPQAPILAASLAAALYPVASHVLSATLAGFPWSESVVQFMTTRAMRLKQSYFDRTHLGWPYDLLWSPIEIPRANWGQLAVESVLMGWVVFTAGSSFPDLARDSLDLVSWISVLLAVGRLLAYGWHCRPPINVWGRIVTGRWIIPGYDQALIGPLCILAVGVVLPLVLRETTLPGPLALAICLTLLTFAKNAVGPSWPRWLLTGNHRLVPGISNRQEFQEI